LQPGKDPSQHHDQDSNQRCQSDHNTLPHTLSSV
jgi:hypothetical protein